MNAAPKYSLTNSSVMVVIDGVTFTFQEGTPNFTALRKAILAEDWSALSKCLTVSSSIEQWAQGKFKVVGEKIFYDGEELPSELNGRISKMASSGEDPSRLFKFWERLQMNPSKRSVDSLWGFLQHEGIPLDENGYIMAYKSVRPDFKDHHSGTIDNHPGQRPSIPRNKVSDDPRCACHEGLHVGALSYAASFASMCNTSEAIILICRIDPKDVVCVPYDESQRKMRVCEYEVVGIQASELSETSYRGDTDDYEDEDDGVEFEPDTLPVKKAPTVPKEIPFETLDAKDEDELMGIDLGTLRTYAARHLKMIGASKIHGGKVALVSKIQIGRAHV